MKPKKSKWYVVALLNIIILGGCSNNDDNPTEAINDGWVTLFDGDQEYDYEFTWYPWYFSFDPDSGVLAFVELDISTSFSLTKQFDLRDYLDAIWTIKARTLNVFPENDSILVTYGMSYGTESFGLGETWFKQNTDATILVDLDTFCGWQQNMILHIGLDTYYTGMDSARVNFYAITVTAR